MAAGIARGARERGRRIAFGNGREIIWDKHSSAIFRNNVNVARPGTERSGEIEWVPFYKGHRLYNRREGDRWVWNMEFRARPGEMFFSAQERAFGLRHGTNFVLIEPNVPEYKSVAANKRWPFKRYQSVADGLLQQSYDVRQFEYPGARMLERVKPIRAMNFRYALAALERAALYVGPEGGLHHGAAAVGTAGVVLFGGFIPPQVTGYATHINLTGGAEACGSLFPCPHCAEAMRNISVDEVLASCTKLLECEAGAAVAM